MDKEIEYIGEHLLPGYLGQFCVTFGFVAILFSIFSYYKACNNPQSDDKSWRQLGRVGFILHGLCVWTLIATLFYMMGNNMYEYAYVQQHVSDELPLRYIFSAFWEGQEGSFLLWMFWHVVLGFILLKKAGEWENGVLLFLGLIQAILASMLLGIHIEIGDFVYKIGSNPTLLLRDVFNAPIFEKADYLGAITGTGLNPLLQNYWMTIHPPTLFLGFASVTVPFAYAAAGFYTGRAQEWVKPVMRWALFSTGILGIGILMGSAWAYEALTFGGYWAWDPVENMSLVPWIIMVAGVHTNLIAQATGRAIRSTFIYYSLGFVGLLYSTYLTRSGILGDTSAHAFTEMGLEPQLIFMVLFFVFLPMLLYIRKSRLVPVHAEEESIYSREFWMFVGALVLLFSGSIIAASTSLPVLNAIISLFQPDFIGTVISDPIPHYNKFQIWIAVLVSVMSAKVVFLRYKTNDMSKVAKMKLAKVHLLHALIAVGFTFLMSLWIDYFHWKYMLLSFCAFFTVVANASFLFTSAKMNTKMAASICSHMGFGIMILGIVTSGLNTDVITTNPFAMKGLLKDKDLASTVTLIKNEPFYVNNYWITYESDTIIENSRSFTVKFEKEDSIKGKVDPFYVHPNVLFSSDLTKIAATNPSAKHFLSKDIFTSIASLPKAQQDIKFAKEEEDSLKYVTYTLDVGDTLFTKEHYGIITGVNFDPNNKDYKEHLNDVGIGVSVRFRSLNGDFDKSMEPAIGVRDNLLYQYHGQLNELGIKLRVNEQTFDNYFTVEEKLRYETYQIKKGASFNYQGEEYTLTKFESQVSSKNYTAEENDIAVEAVLTRSSDGITIRPCYIIRNARPFNLKDYDPAKGVHARMTHLDPINDIITFTMAVDDRSENAVVIEIAENVVRNDLIVLEALVFPGINLFWSGSILMLLGFFLSMWHRRKRHA